MKTGIRGRLYTAGSLLLFTCLRLLLALMTQSYESADFTAYLLPWHQEIKELGGLAALQQQVGNYGIPYQFLICLMTYLPITAISAYKLLSLLFDIILAYVSGRIALLLAGEDIDEHRRFAVLVFTYIAVLFLPTVILNSSLWAQCDSIYTAITLMALLCLCRERDLLAFVLLGVALSLKLQTMLLVPVFLLIALMRRHLHYLVLSFTAWYAMCIPGFLAGRSLLSPFEIYQEQTDTYQRMYLNFPSIWMLIGDNYGELGDVAILWTVVVLAALMLYILYRYRTNMKRLTPLRIIQIACLLTWTCVECLPCMHERYSYSVEILLVILVCINRQFLPSLVLEEAVITMRYRAFLIHSYFSGEDLTDTAAMLYLLAFIAYVVVMFKDMSDDQISATQHIADKRLQ